MGAWDLEESGGGGGGSGTVTSVSVASANGFAGTVANPTTTPAITLTTTVTGVLKGNGTTVSAAVAGTDYLTPSGNGSALTGITQSQVSGSQAGPLTGDVTTSGAAATLVGTSNVESIISANSTVAGALQTTGGTMSGAIAMGSHKITGLTNGSGAQDAAAFGQIPTVAWNVVAASTTHSSAAGEITLCTAGAGGFTVTLPAVVANEQVTVKKVDSGAGTITISPASGTIDGQSTVTIVMQYQSYHLVSDGTNWFVIA